MILVKKFDLSSVSGGQPSKSAYDGRPCNVNGYVKSAADGAANGNNGYQALTLGGVNALAHEFGCMSTPGSGTANYQPGFVNVGFTQTMGYTNSNDNG